MDETKAHVLVVDDSPSTIEVLQRTLQAEGFFVSTASAVPEAVEILEARPIDLVVTDLKMPKVGGLELIRYVRENLKHTAVIMITGYASIESAVAAVKGGAEDYLPKPFTDEELLNAVSSALESLHARRTVGDDDEHATIPTFGLIGASEPMRNVFQSVAKVIMPNATLLLMGESGTGKELLARAIHYNGPRAQAPFVPVNCAGIPETLVESELFGHVKGAFTGAVTTRAGFFITADGGTIFLDEISQLSLPSQAKLLRILEDKQVQMVGASRPRMVDVRVIAATNKDLLGLVKKDLFRDDLYFRLNTLAIDLPPLRDRCDDLLLLIQHFAAKFAEDTGKPVPRFSDRAIDALRRYHWPGNVRELQNVIHRLMVMVDSDTIDVSDLPSLMRVSMPRQTIVNRSLAEVEAEHIGKVLASVAGNKTRAAEILGIDRKTLREKIKHHGITTVA